MLCYCYKQEKCRLSLNTTNGPLTCCSFIHYLNSRSSLPFSGANKRVIDITSLAPSKSPDIGQKLKFRKENAGRVGKAIRRN